MAQYKLIQQMRSRGAPYPDELLKKLSDSECYAWLAKNPKTAKRLAIPKQKPHKKIHFTGFREARKHELMTMAIEGGWTPVVSGSAARSHLCIGETPSKDKIAVARA
ncbi:MAG: hypothetical protein WCK55_02425 [Verrucomicrobiota bacterium]